VPLGWPCHLPTGGCLSDVGARLVVAACIVGAAVKPMKQTFQVSPVRVPHAAIAEWRDFTALGGLVESASRLEVADARVDFRALQPLFGDPGPAGSYLNPPTRPHPFIRSSNRGISSSHQPEDVRTRSHSRTVSDASDTWRQRSRRIASDAHRFPSVASIGTVRECERVRRLPVDEELRNPAVCSIE